MLLFVGDLGFVSCEKEKVDNKQESVSDLVNKHLSISNKIIKSLSTDDFKILANIDLEELKTIKGNDNLINYLESSGIHNSRSLVQLMEEQEKNIIKLRNTDNILKSSFKNHNFKAIENRMDNLIFNDNPITFSKTESSCSDKYDTAVGRCMRNYAFVTATGIATTLLAGEGLLVFAGGTVQYFFCVSDAEDDYNECLN